MYILHVKFINLLGTNLICLAPSKQRITDSPGHSHPSIISQKPALSWIHQAYSSRSQDRYSLHAYFICLILHFIFLRAGLPRGPNFLLWWCQSSCLINSQSKPRCRNFQLLSCLPGWRHVQWVGGFHRNTRIASMRTVREWKDNH